MQDQEVGNVNKIPKKLHTNKDFRKMVYYKIIILLHDNKNMVKESHKKIKIKIN